MAIGFGLSVPMPRSARMEIVSWLRWCPDPLGLTLTPDGVAPTIIDRNVVEGDLVGRSFRTFRFTFSEPVLLTAAADEVFRLIPPPGRL